MLDPRPHSRSPARSSSPGRRPARSLQAKCSTRSPRRSNTSLEDAAAQLLPAGAIYFMMSEDDVRRVLSFPHTMIGSDGLPHDEHPHPRLWGTFPRVLGHYVRDVKLFPLEEAVRRMTALLRRAVRADRPRRAARRRLCRSGAVRSGDDRRRRDLRQAEDAGDGHRRGLRQRPLASGATAAPTGNRPGRALRRQQLGEMGGSLDAA